MGRKRRCKPGPKIPLNKEEVEAYIIKANGNFSKASKMVAEDLNIPMTRQKFTNWVDSTEADWYPKQLRRNMVKSCVDTVLQKGLNKKDNQCLFKIIDKLGKHLDIEDPVQKHEFSLDGAFSNYSGKDLKKVRDDE